jgi:hypothetical protein
MPEEVAVNGFSIGSKKADEFFLQPCKDNPYAQSKTGWQFRRHARISGFAGGPLKKPNCNNRAAQ